MALHWDLTKIVGEDATATEDACVITDALIWATMHVGLNQITDENIEKFATRLTVWERTVGASVINADGTPAYITFIELQQRIGLATNASALTDAAFRKKVMSHLEEQAQRIVAVDKNRAVSA